MNSNIVILIPAFEPDEKLKKLVEELKENGFDEIIVVNDGSSEKYDKIFLNLSGIKYLKNSINMGKGRALKTGFNFYLNEYSKTKSGIITVDSDGQHLVSDVKKIASKLFEKTNTLVLGCRKFSLENVPLKSRVGNILTQKTLKFLCNVKTADTQTGLRGFTNEVIRKVLPISGERFEYETNMLLETSDLKIKLVDVEIETVYYGDNKSTHFRPLVDSYKIYSLILKFAFSGALSAFFDFLIFLFLSGLGISIVRANLISRFSSSILNFNLNRKIVFRTKEKFLMRFITYYALVLVMGLISSFFIKFINSKLSFNLGVSKLIVEIVLFFVSFYIQKKWIFKNNDK